MIEFLFGFFIIMHIIICTFSIYTTMKVLDTVKGNKHQFTEKQVVLVRARCLAEIYTAIGALVLLSYVFNEVVIK